MTPSARVDSSSADAPWRVGAWDLDTDLAKIEQQWAPMGEILADPWRYELRDPAVSGWSCGEHVGHLVITTHGMAGRIMGNLADPERDRDGEWAEFTGRVLEAGRFPRGVAKAPAALDPTGRTRQELSEILPHAIAAWERVRLRSDELPACPARQLHRHFGYLTCTEWVRTCAVHSAHHLAVVRDVEESRGV